MPKHNPEKLTKVTIEVAQRLINKGTPNDNQLCSIALALKKVVAKNVGILAGYNFITLELPWYPGIDEVSIEQVIETPVRACNFMRKLDAHDPDKDENYDDDGNLKVKLPPLPKPFSFKLRIKNKFLRPSLRA